MGWDCCSGLVGTPFCLLFFLMCFDFLDIAEALAGIAYAFSILSP